MMRASGSRLQHRCTAGGAAQRRAHHHRHTVFRADGEKASAAAALRASASDLSSRFEQVEADAKAQRAVNAATDIMSSGDEDLPEIEDLTVDNYDERIAAADPPVVIVDFYTKCGPLRISFFKVNCTKSFKEKGVELGIKVAPTFIFYKNGERERTITGAKLDDVKSALAELGGAA